MKYSELKQSLKNRVEPVYILSGSDDFLRSYSVKLIQNKCLSLPELNFLSFDGENFSQENADAAFNSLRSVPFMSERRVVLIREYYPTAEELKKSGIGEYLKSPSETSVLIVSNKKECKNIEKIAGTTTVNCNPDQALCVGWICNEAKKANLSISPSVALKIAEYCLLDFSKINGELAKLTVYCVDSGVIDMPAVDAVVSKESEYRIYEMVECISSSKYDDAYGILSDLLSKNENEQKLFVSIYSHFRRMLHVAVSDESNAALAEILGVKEYAVKMTRQQVRRFSVKRLKMICDTFAEYDVKFKSGDIGVSEVLWNGVFTSMIA